MRSQLIYIWFPASKTSAFLAAGSSLGCNETAELCPASDISKQPDPGAEPSLAAEELPSRTLLKEVPLGASVSPSGAEGQYPPHCFEASRGLKHSSLYSQPPPPAGDHHAPCTESQGMARAGLGGLHPTQGRAWERARPQAACSNPHSTSRSHFLPWKPPAAVGKQAQGCQVLPVTGPAPSAASALPAAPLRCCSRAVGRQGRAARPEGLQSLVPPRPIRQGRLGARQDLPSPKLALPGHDPPAPKGSFFPRANFIPCLIEKAQQLGHSQLPSSVG